MGQIRKRGGKWQIRYYRNDKKYEESTGSRDHAVAARLLRLREGEIAKGVPVTPLVARYTFEEAAKNIEREYETNARKSLPWTQSRLQKHLLPAFGGRRMSGITTADVRAYCTARQRADAANGTINRELALLKRMFKLAVNDGTLLVAPHIPILIKNNVRKGFFEREQFNAICEHLSSSLRAVVTFVYLTGWRVPSEVLTLQWRQVDFDAGVVRLEPGTTKNGQARVFPFDALLALREVLAEQQRVTALIEQKTSSIVPYVFHGSGKPIRRVDRAWKSACRAAGCPGMIPHDFRRTAVRNLSRAGVPDTIAMKLTGHKTRSIYDRYNVVAEQDLRAGVARLAERATGIFPGTVAKTAAVKPFAVKTKL